MNSTFASLVVVLFALGCSENGICGISAQETLPNIVYVLADDLGYGDIQAFYPEGKIKTPHIDRLARDGMKFTDAHSSSAVCTPTRYGILTGRYNWRSGLKSGVLTGKSTALIPPDRKTVAALLKGKGYSTAFIGKWHLGWDWALKDPGRWDGEGWNYHDFDNIDFTKPVTNTPNGLGFDYAYGHSGSLDMAPYVYVENGRITAAIDTVTEDKGKYSWWRKGPTASDFVHNDITPNFFRRSVSYITEKAKGHRPFFLYLALPSPHTPILPTPPWQGSSKLNPYADFVMMIDDFMGQLISAIEEAGVADNTLVIFTSDNGCSPEADFVLLREKGHDPSAGYRGHKADIFEGGHRVPFIAKWPAMIVPGSVSDRTICTTDFLATCAEIVGLELDDDVGEDSFSMLALFADPDAGDYARECTVHHSINGSFAIRKGRWKLIFAPGSAGWSHPRPGTNEVMALPEIQLYDMKNDPFESQNLYASYPGVVAELKQTILRYVREGRSRPGKPQTNDPPAYGDKEWKQIAIFDN